MTSQFTGQTCPNSTAYQIIEEFIRTCNDRISNSQPQENQIHNDLLRNVRTSDLQPEGHIHRDGNYMFHAVVQSLNAMDGSEYEQNDIFQMVVS